MSYVFKKACVFLTGGRSHITRICRRTSRPVLSHVTAELTPSVYGILKPDYSGKTTLMNIITDNLVPVTSKVHWNSLSVRKIVKEYWGVDREYATAYG